MSQNDKLSPAEIAQLRPDTRLVQGGILRSPFGETAEALYLTQGYVYDTAEQAEARFKGEDPGFIYTRYSNPTAAMFETRLALLEGAEVARATASGMAAVTAALFSQLKAGDHVVAARALFGSCRYVVEELLPRFGVTSTLVDGTDLAQWKAAVRPQTKVFFLESPTNPTLELIDIAAVAEVSKVIYPFRNDHPQVALARRQMRGGGTLVTFEVEGGKAGAFRFLNGLKVARISNNLGDAKSLVTHPATTTHQRFTPEARAEMGISDGMVRLSVGLEHVDDLTEDLERALAAV